MASMHNDGEARALMAAAAKAQGLEVFGGSLRRTSSRFCLGVEHGDYNGTELFGVGTDRFIWLAYKPNGTDRIRLFSVNFPQDGVVDFRSGETPPPRDPAQAHSSCRFPHGVDFILRREGYRVSKGFDAVIYGNIPGGGMSRSASLTLNLMLTMLDVNGIPVEDDWKIIDMAQAVENEYIGSPCGQLDQIMIYFARDGMGTHYGPKDRSIRYVPRGDSAPDFRLVVLDTGTIRPGLETSTYRHRRAECEELAALVGKAFGLTCLADVREQAQYDRIVQQFGTSHPLPCARLKYIFEAQQRFYKMLEAWKAGDLATVGSIFREDGLGLRDDYAISGPELETMCDIVRTVPGVLGERMLGGGDKGAAGALVLAEAVDAVREAVSTAYPRSRPDYAQKFAVHDCKVVDGITLLPGL